MPSPIQILLKRSAHAGDLPLPKKMTAHSAGVDLVAAVSDSVTLQSLEIRLIPCGFHMAIPAGYEAQIRPRSGLAAKHGIALVNAPGRIDADYRGEVMVPMINLGKQPFTIDRGMRSEERRVGKECRSRW